MSTFRFTIKLMVIAAFTLAFASFTQAQATRTWVSGVGDDVNPCSRTAPCKTFAGAISKTAIAGEIDVLDPGGYGAVTITKSITIDGNGTFASILASGTTGVNVNITATDTADPKKHVILRNLSINGTGTSTCSGVTCGLPTGIRGINFVLGKKLTVENCVIFGFTNEGIRVLLTATGSALMVKDTNITNCVTAISMSTSSGVVSFTADHVRLEANTDGLVAGTGANGLMRDSVSSINSGAGVKFTSTGGVVFMEHVLLSQNGTGVQMAASNTAGFSNTTIIGNGTAITAGGTLTGHGNNQINLNGSTPVLPPSIGQQ